MEKGRFLDSRLLLKSGQALVVLIVVMVAGLIITTAAVVYVIVNSQAATSFARGEEAYGVAESGAENAILRLVRDPNYVGETLAINGGTATITVTGSDTRTIISEGVIGDFRRKIQVTGSFVSNVFTVSTWSEVN